MEAQSPGKPVLTPQLQALRKVGRPKNHVPTREQVLVELWMNKKISVARVKALKTLLEELEKSPVTTVTPVTGPILPPWMQDNAAE
jgi:hypothetical protein